MLRLKKGQETFQVVDGPDAGKTYERGVKYDQVAKGYESRFEKVKLVMPVQPKITGTKGSKKP